MALRTRRLTTFRTLLSVRARAITEQASVIVEGITREHFVPGGVYAAGELRDAGFPLSASGFHPSAAGLRAEWDVLIQSGHLSAAYGRDTPHFDPIRKRWRTFVGFDDSAPGSPRGFSFGDVNSAYRSERVDMRQLLSWIMDGTSRMVGRPIVANGFWASHPHLSAMLARNGLTPVSNTGLGRRYPVSRGVRTSPITPTGM